MNLKCIIAQSSMTTQHPYSFKFTLVNKVQKLIIPALLKLYLGRASVSHTLIVEHKRCLSVCMYVCMYVYIRMSYTINTFVFVH